ncbi:MAG: allophanate hydrolase [Pseudomonadales bacterium]|jgi:allophanate hydrolase|nr:allophanate hydrolase [Pseudomonadales bacterium]
MSAASFDEVRAAGAPMEQRLDALAERSRANDAHRIWIERLSPSASLGFAGASSSTGALAGLVFAIKDNIDLAGVPTTAACPAFAYTPEGSATVVQRLIDAGALPLGKTNLDQFATGLVGTRSPYGVCRNAIDPERISGGSSAGSSVAVALGEADFALGTDTAGSGRIPAAFHGLVGMKPSRGLLPNTGVVPACRSLDCVTTFTRTVADAATLLGIMAGDDGLDPGCRTLVPRFLPNPPRVGVPDTRSLAFPDPAWGPAEFDGARARLEAIGCTVVPIDVTPFVRAGALLYEGPWVAERAVAVGSFIAAHPDDVHPVTASIIDRARGFDAVATFQGFDALRTLAADAARVFEQVDAVMVPTADRFPTIEAVLADPIGINTALGRFTNFMNLLDYAAIAVPAGVSEGGLPFGITLFAGAGTDQALLELAAQFNGETWQAERGYPLVLAGAHMDGLPLNHQIRSRGGRLIRRCRTAPGYRMFALPGGPPERPALLADPASEASIEVELWDLPAATIGSFLAGIPAPLGLGRVRLDDGSEPVGFIGAAGAERGALDITAHGGWRGWLAAREASAGS